MTRPHAETLHAIKVTYFFRHLSPYKAPMNGVSIVFTSHVHRPSCWYWRKELKPIKMGQHQWRPVHTYVTKIVN